MAEIFASRRVRRTPFTPGVEAAGVSAYTVYNHMLLPAAFAGGLEDDYHHLKRAVQVWDVSCERQVEVAGPDAERLMRLVSPRDLSRMRADQCYYVPVVDAGGRMLNDPVFLTPAPARWWISIADSDLLLYLRGVADGLGLDVEIFEPDVSPLAVQGPLADELMARVFGEDVRTIGFFRHRRVPFAGRDWLVARSGYSRQGGFEIYVEGAENGMELWDALMAAGSDLEVRAGCPNLIERIEGGLLSYGNDITRENTPFEAGLGRFVNSPEPYLAREAMARLREPARQIRPVAIAAKVRPADRAWPVCASGRQVGQVTSAAWSPDFGETVAIGMIDRTHWEPGTRLEVETPEGVHPAEVRAEFWI